MRRVLESLLSNVRGRMRRRTFVSLVTLGYAVLFAPFLLAIVAPGLVLLELTPALTTLLAAINVAALGFVYVATAFAAAKRLQDMNQSGKAAALTLLPGGFLLLLWIATQPPVDERRGGNRYGRNPRLAQVTRREQRGEQGARRFSVEHKDVKPRDIRRETDKPNQKHVGRTLHGGDGRARGEVQRFG